MFNHDYLPFNFNFMSTHIHVFHIWMMYNTQIQIKVMSYVRPDLSLKSTKT